MKYQLTQEKFDQLSSELQELVTKKKDELNEAWRLAVEEGDDRETDAITVALKLLREHELRVREIKEILENCEVIQSNRSNLSKPKIGDLLMIELDGKEETVQLVDPVESDPLNGKFSIETPLGKALLKCRVGESKEFKTPNGQVKSVTLKNFSHTHTID